MLRSTIVSGTPETSVAPIALAELRPPDEAVTVKVCASLQTTCEKLVKGR